tara:strand:- start:54 stop:380 length:327 start_codon:yes stop_codon:yes gene_type:complete
MDKTMSANSISDRDVARAKALLRMASQQGRLEGSRRRGGTPSMAMGMNPISDKDIEQAKQIIAMFNTMDTTKANTISDRDVAKARDEVKRFTGTGFANGGKVDFKGSF